VYARQYETRPRRMNYDILFRIQGNQALLIPLTTIKGRPVANDQPQERQHRAEIYLEDSDNHSLAGPMAHVSSDLMARINLTVEREKAE
jgi:hypothetical protein